MSNHLSCDRGSAVEISRTRHGNRTSMNERPIQDWVSELVTLQSPQYNWNFRVYCPLWRPEITRLDSDLSRDTPIPGKILDATIHSREDYMSFWNNQTGGASILQEPRRFFMQTPNDGDRFFSFAAASFEKHKRFESIYFSSDPLITVASLVGQHDIPEEWMDNDLAMIFIPVAVAEKHVRYTAKDLNILIKRIIEVEEMIAPGTRDLNLDSLTRELHSCNTALVKLQRRWHFETTLIDTIREFIDFYQEPVSNFNVNLVKSAFRSERDMYLNFTPRSKEDIQKERESTELLTNMTEFRALRSNVGLQRRLSKASEYDLNVLPKRIKNAFAAIFNLIIQRDSRLNFEISESTMKLTQSSAQIAETSQKDAATMKIIAESTLRDSSSMKTIAVMTMIFLPGTFICSFFSMTMFNWAAKPGERVASSYLWVYFVLAVPVTLLVVLVWWLFTKDRRRKDKATLLENKRIV